MSVEKEIGNGNIEIECPECGEIINITLNEAMGGKPIKCSCGTNIDIQIENKEDVDDLKKAAKKLDQTLNNLGK